MRVLIDLDVLLDIPLAREPHLEASAAVLRWAETGGDAVVSWHSLTNCSYLLKGGRTFLKNLLQIAEVAPVSTGDAINALRLPMADVEDAFQAAAAQASKADFIITRNVRDFRNSPVPAITPADFLKRIQRS